MRLPGDGATAGVVAGRCKHECVETELLLRREQRLFRSYTVSIFRKPNPLLVTAPKTEP